MNLADLPDALIVEIDTILAAGGIPCQPDRTTFTAGEPAHPAGVCSAVWVWVDALFDMGGGSPLLRTGDEEGCVLRPAVDLRIRVDVCYQEHDDGTDLDDAEHAETADCLHSLMRVIWCGLADMWAAGTLLNQVDCRRISLGGFTVGARAGGIVSASMPVIVEYDCEDIAS